MLSLLGLSALGVRLLTAAATQDAGALNPERLGPELVVLVLSSPENKWNRTSVRETWMMLAANNPKVETRFVLSMNGEDGGNKIRDELDAENEKYDDLLFLEDEIEAYDRLTHKVIKAVQWASEMRKPKYVIKTDENAFVRVDMFLDELPKLKTQEKLYMGFFRANVPNNDNKWHDSAYTLCDTNLPYALGGGYLISGDVAAYLAASAPMLMRWKNEDVAMGTWLSTLDLNRVHDTRFDTMSVEKTGCTNDALISKGMDYIGLHQRYKRLSDGKEPCAHEIDRAPGHKQPYDFKKTPLQNHISSECLALTSRNCNMSGPVFFEEGADVQDARVVTGERKVFTDGARGDERVPGNHAGSPDH